MSSKLTKTVADIVASIEYNPQLKAQAVSFLSNLKIVLDALGETIEDLKFSKKDDTIKFTVDDKKFTYKIFGGIVEEA